MWIQNFFINNTPSNFHSERGLQINDKHVIGNDAILDLTPDDHDAIRKSRQMTKWDRKKKKFIRESPDEANAKKGSLKDKTNFYHEWQKRTHGRVQNIGEEEHAAPRFGNVRSADVVRDMKQKNHRANPSELRDESALRKFKTKQQNFKKDKKRGGTNGKGDDRNSRFTSKFIVVPPRKGRHSGVNGRPK